MSEDGPRVPVADQFEAIRERLKQIRKDELKPDDVVETAKPQEYYGEF